MPLSDYTSSTTPTVKLLVVDTDPEALDVLEAFLRDLFETRCQVDRAVSVSQALGRLKTSDYHIILSEQTLPDGSGIDMLEEAHNTQRDAVRVLLTASLDEATAVAAINSGRVFRLVAKPWHGPELEQCIRNALAWRQHGLAMRILLDEQRKTHLALADSLSRLERTQRQMIHVERLATVGRLTSGIIHEVRNQLTGLMGVVDTLRYDGGGAAEHAQRAVDVVRKLVARIASIESFARGGGWSYDMVEVSAGALLDQIQALYQLEVGEPGLLVAAKPEIREARYVVDADKLTHAVLAVVKEGHDRFDTPVRLRAELRSDGALRLEMATGAVNADRARVRRRPPPADNDPSRTVVIMILDAHGGTLTVLDPDEDKRGYARIVIPVREAQPLAAPPHPGPTRGT